MVENKDHNRVVLDKLTYAGDLENLMEIRGQIEFIQGYIVDPKAVSQAMKDCEMVVNFATEHMWTGP